MNVYFNQCIYSSFCSSSYWIGKNILNFWIQLRAMVIRYRFKQICAVTFCKFGSLNSLSFLADLKKFIHLKLKQTIECTFWWWHAALTAICLRSIKWCGTLGTQMSSRSSSRIARLRRTNLPPDVFTSDRHVVLSKLKPTLDKTVNVVSDLLANIMFIKGPCHTE